MKRFAAFLAGLFASLVLVIVVGAAILGYGIGDIKGFVCSFMNWRLEGHTIEERLDEIASKCPDLVAAAESMKGDLSVLVFKQERIVELRSPGWTNPRVYQMTGFSGALGPKFGKDDGQIPEGVYGIESLNPGGIFHLEMKVSYPNKDDKRRARDEGRTEPDGEVMIRGGSVSGGSIPLGDKAIEEVFFLVAKAGFRKVKVIIAPYDMRLCRREELERSEIPWYRIRLNGIFEELTNWTENQKSAYGYGFWVEKGPRIVDENGNTLRNAEVTFEGDRLEFDEEGRMILRRYVDPRSHAHDRFCVTCPGYYRKSCAEIFTLDGGVKGSVTLRKILKPHQMRNLDNVLRFYKKADQYCCEYDMLIGDFLPPHGFGEHADARIEISKADKPFVDFITTMSLPGNGDGAYMCEREDPLDDLEISREVEKGRCVERTLKDEGRFRPHKPIYFRVRGLYGCLQLTTGTDRGMQTLHVVGRINTVPGEPGLEMGPRVPPKAAPPVAHPAVTGRNLLSFGVSEDRRSAVYLGPVDSGKTVPAIFRDAVYTAAPSNDLASVEMLYIDSFDADVPAEAFAGMPSLMTVAFAGQPAGVLGERAFAGCPKLETVLFGRDSTYRVFPDNVYEGVPKRPAEVRVEENHYADPFWTDHAVTNIYSRKVVLRTIGHYETEKMFRPEADLRHGTIELPRYRLTETALEKVDSRGRMTLWLKDGVVEKRFATSDKEE